MPWSEETRRVLLQKRVETEAGGGEGKQQKEHEKGKLTARERLKLLFDGGTFTELEEFSTSRVDLGEVKKKHYSGDGIVCGFGRVNGSTAYAVAQDSTISGGAGGETHINKMCRTLKLAISTRSPFISLCDSGGARIEEGIISLSAYSELFRLNTVASGLIPQIAAIMGNCAGGSSYSPAMCDFVFMVKSNAQFFITGPKVIKALIGEDVTMDELGGTDVHGRRSGQAHFVCENDTDCIDKIRQLLRFVQEKKKPYGIKSYKNERAVGKRLEEIVPENKKLPYDVREVIERLSDDQTFFEVQEDFAKNITVGFLRMDGCSIGVVANQSMVMGGAIDCDAADKCARFVRFCDCFDIPLLVLVDVPGFLPGTKEEKKGILRHGSKILYAFAEASVPKVTLILRKAYGGAYCAMNSKALGADVVFAWPICEIAVMGADGAVDVLFHQELQTASDPERLRAERTAEYEKKYLNPYFAASYGMVDQVILPDETRERIIESFRGLENKTVSVEAKKHGNIAL